MEKTIKKVAVLGSGVMGTGIAAHLAGCGIPVRLLDIVPFDLSDEDKKKPAKRNKLATDAVAVAKKVKKPTPVFYSPANIDLIEIGNFDDDMEKIADCDWIIEVVVERLDIKLQVMEKIAAARKKGSIVSTNTSGIPLKEISAKMDDEFKAHFCGTHFFNPVRHMKLLEIIPGAETSCEVLDLLNEFGATVLGKGLVLCKDTPSFIANRIGVYGMAVIFDQMQKLDYRIEEIDAIYGAEMGRPKSAVFKTADLVGLDTLQHILKNSAGALKDIEDAKTYDVPPFVEKLVADGALGNKSNKGFYKKEGKDRFVYDWKKGEYVALDRVKFDIIKEAKGKSTTAEKLQTVAFSDDRAGQFAWKTTAAVLLYCANRVPEISDNIYSIDDAMRWGYMWELGPFETWDALGVKKVVKKMEEDGLEIPESIKNMIANSEGTFYVNRYDGKYCWDLVAGEYVKVPQDPRILSLANLKKNSKIVEENAGISLIDMGDGILNLEFHTFPYHMNPIDDKIILGLHRSIELSQKLGFRGIVVGHQAANFCAGANLVMISMLASQKEWDKLNEVVAALQDANMAMKYSPIPMVTATAGMALGGGCEIQMHGQVTIAAAESYIGMVEMAVGLLPAGGGTKELTLRCMQTPAPTDNLLPFARKAFETIAMAKVSMSAQEAMELNLLRPGHDKIVINRDMLLYEAKQTALGMAVEGFDPGRPRTDITVSGSSGYSAFCVALEGMKVGGYISEHDVKIVRKIAAVISGGTHTKPGAKVSEQHLLDLEREGFVSLCGEEKSLERIQHMVMNNKPLRN